MDLPLLEGGKKTILVVLDGRGDRRSEGRLTPLESAETPTLDELAKRGSCGMHYPLSPGIPVGSGLAHTLLFGYKETDYPGRGVLEAFGAGIPLKPTDLAFRINFATADENYIVVDRRAGRRGEFIPQMAKDLEEALNNNPFGVKVRLVAYEGYRGVLVISGDLLKPIKDLDPQVPGKPVRFSEDRTTGRIVNWIVMKSYEVLKNHPLNERRKELGLLPANIILPRGAGKVKERIPFDEKYGMLALGIADRNLYLGAARYFGMETVKLPDKEKIPFLLENFEKYDFFFVHFKLTDVYGHDGKWEEKKKYIEEVDKMLKPLLEVDAAIAVTGDHSTPVSLKNHSGDAIPLLIYGGDVDETRYFGENECSKGRIGFVRANDVLPLLFNAAGRMGEVGK